MVDFQWLCWTTGGYPLPKNNTKAAHLYTAQQQGKEANALEVVIEKNIDLISVWNISKVNLQPHINLIPPQKKYENMASEKITKSCWFPCQRLFMLDFIVQCRSPKSFERTILRSSKVFGLPDPIRSGGWNFNPSNVKIVH